MDPVDRLQGADGIQEAANDLTLASAPSPRPNSLEFIVRHNPAYLISALLMFSGIYMVVQPSRQHVGQLTSILATFGTLEVYEALLLAVAVFLVCFRKVLDDGATVIVIESLFVVGCFMILDEIVFNPERIFIGLSFGLAAAVLATVRFALLGRSVRGLVPGAVLILLAAFFLWNGFVPGGIADLAKDANQRRMPVWVGAWWSLAALGLGLAVLCVGERRHLWRRQQPFLDCPIATYAIVGLVAAATVIHQLAIGYALDLEFYLCDLLPLATALSIAAVLLGAATTRAGVMECLAAAVPAALCCVALLVGDFTAIDYVGGQRQGLIEWIRGNPRALTWPVGWLGIIAVLMLVQAWRHRSRWLALQGTLVVTLMIAFRDSTSPDAVQLNLRGLAFSAAICLLACGAMFRSALATAGSFAILNWLLLDLWPPQNEAILLIPATPVVLASTGISLLLLWFVFRRTVSPWLAHIGCLMLLLSAIRFNTDPSTEVPVYLLSAGTLGLALLHTVMARLFRWRFYYVFSVLYLCLSPAKLVTKSKETMGSPGGWLLILASFAALGIGVYLSARKSERLMPQPHQG
jgi:hypothetical protein